MFIQVQKDLKKELKEKFRIKVFMIWVLRLHNQTRTAAGKAGTDQTSILLIGEHDSTTGNKERKWTEKMLWQIQRKKRKMTGKQCSYSCWEKCKWDFCPRAINEKPVESRGQVLSLIDTIDLNIDHI